jgi:hypothetical protein
MKMNGLFDGKYGEVKAVMTLKDGKPDETRVTLLCKQKCVVDTLTALDAAKDANPVLVETGSYSYPHSLTVNRSAFLALMVEWVSKSLSYTNYGEARRAAQNSYITQPKFGVIDGGLSTADEQDESDDDVTFN